MTRIRKSLLFALTALALATPATIQAHPPQSGGMTTPRPQQHYIVYYRFDPESPWYQYYTFRDLQTAQRYANWIYSAYGYDVYIR